MHRLNPENSFTDLRGTIEDLVIQKIDAVTRISFAPNAIRGNHIHYKTTQWTLVIKGIIEASTLKNGKIVTDTFKEGDFFVSYPGEPHAMKALSSSQILVLTQGPRAGNSFESDTHRIHII